MSKNSKVSKNLLAPSVIKLSESPKLEIFPKFLNLTFSGGTLSPRELDHDSITETEESSLHLPNQKKLPSLDELDKNFVELDRNNGIDIFYH